MAERVIVRQESDFGTEILAQDPHHPDDNTFHVISDVRRLTPYGMLLAGLGSCTAIVLHTYAYHHDVPLNRVEMRLVYDRVYAEDCETCEAVESYAEQIEMAVELIGDLTPDLRRRLLSVSRQCPIHKMLNHGIEVQSHLVEEPEA